MVYNLLSLCGQLPRDHLRAYRPPYSSFPHFSNFTLALYLLGTKVNPNEQGYQTRQRPKHPCSCQALSDVLE